MNSKSCLLFYHSFAAVRFVLMTLHDIVSDRIRYAGIFLKNYFLVWDDTPAGVCAERMVLRKTGKTGMLFSVVATPVATANRTKEKSR